MTLTYLKFHRFTAFDRLELDLSPGINVFIGTNGTGKTHLMKAAYAACDITKSKLGLADKLVRVFLPSNRHIGRMVKRQKGSSRAKLDIRRGNKKLTLSFSNHAKLSRSATSTGEKDWVKDPVESVYIPVKEMLANAVGFRSLYAQREIHFEEIYADILDRAYRPPLRGPAEKSRKSLMNSLQKIIDGRVIVKEEEFFLRNKEGNLEFSLLAEGMRKLGLLWLLIQNGTLLKGSVLFWDEPESNLNPKLFGTMMEILLALQRQGVQVFLATHDYVILKELDLRRRKRDKVAFHSLYRDEETNEIALQVALNYQQVHPNAIADAFSDIYDREVERSLGAVEV